MTCRAHKPLRTTCGSSQPIASRAGFIRKRSLISIRTGGRRTADNDITAYVPVRTVTLSSDTDHAMHRTSQSLALESYPLDGQTQRLAAGGATRFRGIVVPARHFIVDRTSGEVYR